MNPECLVVERPGTTAVTSDRIVSAHGNESFVAALASACAVDTIASTTALHATVNANNLILGDTAGDTTYGPLGRGSCVILSRLNVFGSVPLHVAPIAVVLTLKGCGIIAFGRDRIITIHSENQAET